ncbi:helix-turn-helix domain-containing protein [Fuchsiella alkaliacetigena]|uniref:helix-turn-helix domain-containing protein n=1 Tax=Fuchsiella alkaliacetigena TaxID=957042 RepID=UPI00200B6C61|nr:helix-turn-helix domain-containing protein [Fuchsiella alkaliacetigena]MCK8824706.1 helix-turn-helix domain containing protein [Fuchsiella alkaliacetigena]
MLALDRIEGVEKLERLRNYLALICCIANEIAPSTALEGFGLLDPNKEQQIIEMIQLKKQGLSYKDIGSRYNLSADAVYNRIRRYMQNQGAWKDRDW